MGDIECDVRMFTTLSAEERQELSALMAGHRPDGQELFLRWLRVPLPGMYGAIVRIDGRLIGFAAASLRDGDNAGMIGVFISPSRRGQGLAVRALDVLLEHVAHLPAQERPEYFYYEVDKARLFRPPIERHRFKDFFAHRAEYAERRRRVTNLSP